MGTNDTKVTTVLLGGALATIAMVLFNKPLIEIYGGPLPPGFEGALGMAITAIIAWMLPAKMIRKLGRRTAATPPKETP